jgi:hypothetical protein
MVLPVGTLSRAGPLSADILDLQVAERGPDARVVTGERIRVVSEEGPNYYRG